MIKLPYKLFWAIALIFLTLEIYFRLVGIDSTVDVNFHDTYYVIAHAHFFRILAVWFALCGLGYWILLKFKIKLIKWMFWAHLVLSLLFVLSWMEVKPEITDINSSALIQSLRLFGLLGFVLGQVLYFLNILLSTLKQKK